MSKIYAKLLSDISKRHFHRLTFTTCTTQPQDHVSLSVTSPNVSFNRSLFFPSDSRSPKLSPQQVQHILKASENSFYPGKGVVTNFDINKLPANAPIEDRDASARLALSDEPNEQQFLFGVFDGHAGPHCAQVVSERLYNYIAVAMSPPEIQEKIRHHDIEMDKLLHWYHGPKKNQFSDEMEEVYKAKLAKFATEFLALHSEDATVKENLASAFNRLDEDLSSEALPSTLNALNYHSLKVAFSGACACVGFIDNDDLYIANVGDCQALLGVQVSEDEWNPVLLSKPHDANNASEIRRLLNAHPNEGANMIKAGRLFGSLIPLRSFGDVRYKWSQRYLKHVERIDDYNIHIYGDNLIPHHYNTPPYLTADPEIIHYTLTPKDKFLVLASDGLWERLSPEEVVKLVAGHIEGRNVPLNFQPESGKSLKDINNDLKKRKMTLTKKPVDENVATHLIRNALGPDMSRISNTLSLPASSARYDRDDITVMVIYFNSHFLKDRYIHQDSR